jgi:hypothetical protein
MLAKGTPDSWDMTGNRDRPDTVASKQRDWRTPEKFFLQMRWNRLYKLKIICQLSSFDLLFFLIIPDEEKTLGLLNLPGALASGPLIAISVGISSIRRPS